MWHGKLHYNSNHFWDIPMQPERLRESTCIKCHHSVVELGVHPKFGASAPKLYKGYNLIKEYGCFGCHEIQGFDGTRPIGPDLRLEPSTEADAERSPRIRRKLPARCGRSDRLCGTSEEALAGVFSYWIEEPQRFRPTTRMPKFFHTTNLEDRTANRLAADRAGGHRRITSRTTSRRLSPVETGRGLQPNRIAARTSSRSAAASPVTATKRIPKAHATFGPELSKVHCENRSRQRGRQFPLGL